MDNLSHSLIGLIAGESIARSGRARESSLAPGIRRGLLVTSSVVGSNLPDLDLVYSWHPFSRSVPAKLDYVLQHRGYTHTVVVCVVLAALLYGAAELWVRWRRLLLSRSDRLVLAGTCLFAVGLHLAMDFLNSYGVHPFWPWRNRWFYGDSVFIVEPLYWAAALALFFQVRSMSARVVIGVAPAFAAVVCLLLHLVTPLGCAGYALLSIAMLLVGARASAAVAAFTSAGVALVITLLFVVAGRSAARRIDTLAAAELPGGHVIDHVLSPAPMNPLCWDVLLLETRGDRYAARFGVLSILPAAVPARQCPRTSGRGSSTAPVAPLAAPARPEIEWLNEFSMSRALLARLTDSNCRAAALMHFARAPFAAVLEDRWVMGDLRFDRTRGGGMASIDLGPASEATKPTGRDECHSPVPWGPPRADLLDLRR